MEKEVQKIAQEERMEEIQNTAQEKTMEEIQREIQKKEKIQEDSNKCIPCFLALQDL